MRQAIGFQVLSFWNSLKEEGVSGGGGGVEGSCVCVCVCARAAGPPHPAVPGAPRCSRPLSRHVDPDRLWLLLRGQPKHSA